MNANHTIGARILNELHERLPDPEAACALVRPVIRELGEDSPQLAQAVLDKLHMELPFPTQACAIVRIALGQGGPNAIAA